MTNHAHRQVDLHCHSSVSCGAMGLPTAIPSFFAHEGYAAFAITDHDKIDALQPAGAVAHRISIEYIPAVEVSTRVNDPSLSTRSAHVLGYYLTPTSALRDLLARIHGRYMAWIRGALDRLGEESAPVTEEELRGVIAAYFGADDQWKQPYGCVWAVSILLRQRDLLEEHSTDGDARALLNRLYPGDDLPPGPDVAEVCCVLAEAGAVRILAHPGHQREASIAEYRRLEYWLDHYVDGLEVYTPKHSPDYIAMAEEIVRRRGRPFTGGTDRHEYVTTALRSDAPYACVESLKAFRAARCV